MRALSQSVAPRATRRPAQRRAPPVPRRVPVGRRHLRLPDRGRHRPRRPRAVHLGHVRGRRPRPRRHRRPRGRPPPPDGRRRRPDRRAWACRPTGSRSPGPGCSPRAPGAVSQPGLDFYRALVDELLASGIEPDRHPVPLGPPPGPRGRRRLAGPRHRRPVRRLRRRRGRCARRSGAALDHDQRALVRGHARLRRRHPRPRPHRTGRGRGRRPPPAAGARAGHGRATCPRVRTGTRRGPAPGDRNHAQPLSGGCRHLDAGDHRRRPRRRAAHRRHRQPAVVRRGAAGGLPRRRARGPGAGERSRPHPGR